MNALDHGNVFADRYGKRIVAGIFALPLAAFLLLVTGDSLRGEDSLSVLLWGAAFFGALPTALAVVGALIAVFVVSWYFFLPSTWSLRARIGVPLALMLALLLLNAYGFLASLSEFTL